MRQVELVTPSIVHSPCAYARIATSLLSTGHVSKGVVNGLTNFGHLQDANIAIDRVNWYCWMHTLSRNLQVEKLIAQKSDAQCRVY